MLYSQDAAVPQLPVALERYCTDEAAAGTISPVERIVAGPTPENTICNNCEADKPLKEFPTKILPAVPVAPGVPVQPVIVIVCPVVHETPLLAAKVKV